MILIISYIKAKELFKSCGFLLFKPFALNILRFLEVSKLEKKSII